MAATRRSGHYAANTLDGVDRLGPGALVGLRNRPAAGQSAAGGRQRPRRGRGQPHLRAARTDVVSQGLSSTPWTFWPTSASRSCEANAYEGRIETLPRIAPGFLVFMKPGNPDPTNAFCRRCRRTAIGCRSSFNRRRWPASSSHVTVFKELEDLPRPTRATRGRGDLPHLQRRGAAVHRHRSDRRSSRAGFPRAATFRWSKCCCRS